MGKNILIDNVPDDIHSKFKSKAALEHSSIKDKIIKLMADYIECDKAESENLKMNN